MDATPNSFSSLQFLWAPVNTATFTWYVKHVVTVMLRVPHAMLGVPRFPVTLNLVQTRVSKVF